MKKILLLMLLTAFTAVASFAQPAKRIHARPISPEQVATMRAAKPQAAMNASALRAVTAWPASTTAKKIRKAPEDNAITEVRIYGYEPPVAGEESRAHLNFTVPDGVNYSIDSSTPIWWDNDTDDSFYGTFVEGTTYSMGMTLKAADGYTFSSECKFYINDDESIVDYTYTGLDEEDNTLAYLWSVPTVTTSPVPELTFTPFADFELTYGSTEGDVAGKKSDLLSGIPTLGEDEYEYAALYITNTNLVNVADPNDQLVMALTGNWDPSDNLKYYSPLMVDGQEIEYTETDYSNEDIQTLAGQTLEYIYIDNSGTEEDFAKVKDVLAGKIAVCNRGSISFYVKANAAMANGAAGIIVVNNQEGIINMALEGYEYTNPAIAITQEAGTLLKSNAEYVTDGEAPYYVGTLEMGEVVAGHNELGLGFGKDYYVGGYYSDYEIKAWVPDWTNATPGATYKATITYPSCNYSIWNADINSYDVYPVEIGTLSTTVTVTIPGEEITEVRIYGYEPPVAGEASAAHLNFTVPDGVNYSIDSSTPIWWDNGTDHSFDGTFVEGTSYSMGMTLKAADGYTFASECKFYINDDESIVDYTYTGLDEEDNTVAYLRSVPTVTTSPVPELTFTPFADFELTYGNTEGDVAGTKYSLLSGMPELGEDEYEYASLYITNTNLVNVADPNDQLVMALRTGYYELTDNLKYYSPLMVDGQEIEYSETTGGGNESIQTLAGQTLEYIYIDNYGTEEDFAKVKDVLAGKIAVCNRGGISFYVKANAAMANGAAGIIIVNNQERIVNMSLEGYEYDKPAVSIKMADGTLLKEKGEFVDGEAPYYVGTLEIGEVVPGQNETNLGIGKDYNSGRFADYEIKAWVPDWTNATPGATYKATITYSYCTYYIWNADISDYDVYPVEIGTPSTTVTVTIPGEENAIDDVTADRNAKGDWYALDGRKLATEPTQHGVYIKNGRKYVK